MTSYFIMRVCVCMFANLQHLFILPASRSAAAAAAETPNALPPTEFVLGMQLVAVAMMIWYLQNSRDQYTI